ncbi:unnamed protein product [Cuscuta campestris]|uniref:IQ domain-containing protein IQM3 n=1 Tax=Cuscuta campestris TaxID=132261 RepID=A0A484MJ37_9ASTE|nr:unnamed protein product [Cuscuta campestris]
MEVETHSPATFNVVDSGSCASYSSFIDPPKLCTSGFRRSADSFGREKFDDGDLDFAALDNVGGNSSSQPILRSESGFYAANGTDRSGSASSGAVEAEDKLQRCTSNAAMKVQKVYRSYRTRRMLADSAVVAEELWWQALDYARLNHSTISFFNFLKPETTTSRWNRVRLNASKVGKGLSKDEKAQKLAFQHWIEAIDPRHRYGHNLHFYYEEWCMSDSGQPFFFWLDLGDGRKVDLKKCPRSKLQQQCIKYLGPQERDHYEYVVVEGKVVNHQTGKLLDTTKGSPGVKWIFVMSTTKKLYAGEKKKGIFHHSSFLAGGATLAAGRLVVEDGTPKCISPYSGHYRPSDDSLNTFLLFLKENGVNLDEVQIKKANEDYENYEEQRKATKSTPKSEIPMHSAPPPPPPPPPYIPPNEEKRVMSIESLAKLLLPPTAPVPVPAHNPPTATYKRTLSGGLQGLMTEVPKTAILRRINSKNASSSYQLGQQLSRTWSTGAGPRIGCVADYPAELRSQALELTNLTPKPAPGYPGLISSAARASSVPLSYFLLP